MTPHDVNRSAAFLLPLMRACLLIDERHATDMGYGYGDVTRLMAGTAIYNAIGEMALALGLATDGPFGAHGEIFKALWTSARADLGMPC